MRSRIKKYYPAAFVSGGKFIVENNIKTALTDPQKLEELYQKDKQKFRQAFRNIISDLEPTDLIRYWQIRLQFQENQIYKFSFGKRNFLWLLLCIILVTFLVRLPHLFNFSDSIREMYEIRNFGIIIFLGITLYELLRKGTKELNLWLGFTLAFMILALHLKTMPSVEGNQTLNLALIHAPIVCWFLYGLAMNVPAKVNRRSWVKFLRFNGDLVVFSGLIMICWFIILGITVVLFESLSIKFDDVLMLDMIKIAGVISPLIAVFAIERIPALENKLVPLIARIFNPVVLIVLVIYLITIIQAGKNIFGERDFLIVFNLVLFSVLVVILFSLSNFPEQNKFKYHYLILYLLTLLSCSLNMIALSAIIYRLISFGITPNRLAVIGMNLLVFANLIKIGLDLMHVFAGKREPETISLNIAGYLPLYGTWALIIVILFPLIFN